MVGFEIRSELVSSSKNHPCSLLSSLPNFSKQKVKNTQPGREMGCDPNYM